jgi:hypothetical protein
LVITKIIATNITTRVNKYSNLFILEIKEDKDKNNEHKVNREFQLFSEDKGQKEARSNDSNCIEKEICMCACIHV